MRRKSIEEVAELTKVVCELKGSNVMDYTTLLNVLRFPRAYNMFSLTVISEPTIEYGQEPKGI